MTHIDSIVVASRLRRSIKGIMLDTSHGIMVGIVALIATNHGCTHLRRKIRILACAFGHPSPTWIEGNVYHRTIHPVDARGSSFGSSHLCCTLNHSHIPRAGLRQRQRENSLIAMYHVLSEEERNAETCLLDCYLLQILYLLHALHIKDGTKLTSSYLFGKWRIHYSTSCKVASGEKIELANLLLKSHFLHQFCDELTHRRQLLLLCRKPCCRRKKEQCCQCNICFLHTHRLFLLEHSHVVNLHCSRKTTLVETLLSAPCSAPSKIEDGIEGCIKRPRILTRTVVVVG